MTDKKKVIKKLKEALDSLDITSNLRLILIQTIEYLQEEPVSEELEEAAKEYSGKSSHPLNNAFKAGAEWQKKQDQETIELAEDHAMLAGMEKMKEQMMAKAIDATIGSFTNGTIYDADFDIDSNLKDNDKVKVIVIKED